MNQEARGTGRTTRAVTAALVSALAGNRVCYMVHAAAHIDHCRRIAERVLDDAVKISAKGAVDITISREVITFYRGGRELGMLRFRSISSQEKYDINAGLQEPIQFRLIDDHWCAVVREQERYEKERAADLETIRTLLRKHNVTKVSFHDSMVATNISFVYKN